MNQKSEIFFSKEQVQTLLQGLTTLEGALTAIEQPIPDHILELKWILNSELQSLTALGSSTLTTNQVAQYLGCSTKKVYQLAAKGHLKVAKPGNKGRGNATYFFKESVFALKRR